MLSMQYDTNVDAAKEDQVDENKITKGMLRFVLCPELF